LKIRVIKKAASPPLRKRLPGFGWGKFYAAVACAFACGAGVVAGAGAGGCGPFLCVLCGRETLKPFVLQEGFDMGT